MNEKMNRIDEKKVDKENYYEIFFRRFDILLFIFCVLF